MTAKEIFEEYCKLPQAEQNKVMAYLMGMRLDKDSPVARPEVTAKFREIAAEVFTTNEELFKKLAN